MLRSRRSAAARPVPGSSRAQASVAFLFILSFVVAAAPARAVAAPPAAPSSTASKPARPARAPDAAGRGTTGPGGKKVISLDDDILVEGQLEKPSAFYVLQRSSTDYDWARLDASMTPLVLESVWDPLF